MIIGGAGTHGAAVGYYPVPQGAHCLAEEPELAQGYSDAALDQPPTPVTDNCRCLAPSELSAGCTADLKAGVPGDPPNRIQDTCVSEDGAGGSERATCYATGATTVRGNLSCAEGLSCASVRKLVARPATRGGCAGPFEGSSTTALHYSDVCYDIEVAARFRGASWDDWLGQHSIHSAEWFWCFTAGQCATTSSAGGYYSAGGCGNYWAYLDRVKYSYRGALCTAEGKAPSSPPANSTSACRHAVPQILTPMQPPSPPLPPAPPAPISPPT
eukprot:3578187-Prymnesium_polylepis.1